MLGVLLSVVMLLLIFAAVPYLVGNGACSFLNIDKTVSKNYFVGMVVIWAAFQLVTVPLVLLKASFTAELILMSVILLGMSFYGVWKGKFPAWRAAVSNRTEMFAYAVMFFAMGLLLVCTIFLQHTDWDDSRFVVNAVDIVRTNRMLLTDCITGEALSAWSGELAKDVTAPWAVYIAYCAKITGIPAVVMAHTILPVVLLLCAFCVFWMLSEVFGKGNDTLHRCIFVSVMILLNVYGHFSVYSSETFLLTRLWQGKSVVAGIGILAVFLISMWIYEEEQKKGNYILLLLLNLAMCLMSGMGLIIGALMLGCIGFVYGIVKRNWKMALTMWAFALPNVIYYVIHAIL